VGHDLTRGSSTFLRSQRPARPDPSEVEQEVESTIRQQEMEGSPSVDSWGNQVDPPPEGPEDGGEPDGLGGLDDRSGLGGLGAA
jgi:hypothetical protein